MRFKMTKSEELGIPLDISIYFFELKTESATLMLILIEILF